MKKNILVIDDDPDARALDELREQLEYTVNEGASVSYNIQLKTINPTDFIPYGQPTEDTLNSLFAHLDSAALNEKLDLVLCDFNLHQSNKDLAFHIVDHVRKHNKCCSVMLYSGSPLKELTRINNQELANKISTHIIQENPKAEVNILKTKIDQITKEELPSEELLKLAIHSNITTIVSRNNYEDAALEVIKNPSLLLRIENNLCCYDEDEIFIHAGFSINGMKIGVICDHLRRQTTEGIRFSEELIELMTSHYIQLNHSN